MSFLRIDKVLEIAYFIEERGRNPQQDSPNPSEFGGEFRSLLNRLPGLL